jgi:hypothetical protein
VQQFVVGDPSLETTTIQVPVRITFSDGDVEEQQFAVIVDANQDSKVCGLG